MTARDDSIEALSLPNMERRVANMVRVGTVMAVDPATARVRIKSGSIETAWLPWSTGRAHPAKRRWDPPAVGEQVAIIAPGGDMRQAVVLPGVYQQSAGAPASSPDKDTTVYGDGTVIEYDRATHTLVANLGPSQVRATRDEVLLQVGGASLRVTASGVQIVGNLSINGISGAAGVTMNGDIQITGATLSHNGKNIGSTHSHSGVQPGGSNTGAPT
jgi:phage baseplate assembly protein V